MIRIDIYTQENVPSEIAKKATAAALNLDESKISVLKRSQNTGPGVYVFSRAIAWDVERFPYQHTIKDPTEMSNYPETWSVSEPRNVTQLIFARAWSKVAGVDVLAQVFTGMDDDEWFIVHPDGTEELFEMPEEEEDDWDEEENEDDEADE